MTDVDRGVWARVGGSWKPVDQEADANAGIWVRVNGSWKRIDSNDPDAGVWCLINGTWKRVYPKGGATPPEPPAPGTYVLPSTALYINPNIAGNSYVEADTSPYQGYITQLRIRIAYRSDVPVHLYDIGVRGRPNNRYYREISDFYEWAGRTIDHRIDTFNATSLTDFNSGAAIGYNLDTTGDNYRPADYISNLWVVVTV